VNHPTPRTDFLWLDLASVTDLMKHARTLEQELAECRLRLAMELCHVASEAENYGNAEAAANYRATAAHLRDLSQPLDPSKL